MANGGLKLDDKTENIGGVKEVNSQEVSDTVNDGEGKVAGILSFVEGIQDILKEGHVIHQSDMGMVISHNGIYHCISYKDHTPGLFYGSINYLKIKKYDKDGKINTWEKDKYNLPSKEEINFLLGILSGDPDNFTKLGFEKGGKYLLSGTGHNFTDGHVFQAVSLKEAKSGKNYLIDGFRDQEYKIREKV